VRASPRDVDRELRRSGFRPAGVVAEASLDPSTIRASEWNALGPDDEKVCRYAEGWGDDVPAVLVVPEGAGYKAVDGLHRARAAERVGARVDAIVLDAKAYEHVAGMGGALLYEWAHGVVG